MANSMNANGASTPHRINTSTPSSKSTQAWTVDALQRLAVDTFRSHAPLLLINYLASKLGFELLQMLLIMVRPDRLFPKLFATEEMYNLHLAWTQYEALFSQPHSSSTIIPAQVGIAPEHA